MDTSHGIDQEEPTEFSNVILSATQEIGVERTIENLLNIYFGQDPSNPAITRRALVLPPILHIILQVR